MALGLVNNVAALNAQSNLTRTNNALSKSLERLSSGLKVNRGADGPAALVISEKQRAQIAGLQTAIDNTNKAVSLVQTGEGALNEINTLLTKVRGLALDSANSAVQDADSLAANQAEITNALNTITQIAKTTQFGSRKLLDGSATVQASTSTADVSVGVVNGANVTAGSYDFTITGIATRANTESTVDFESLSTVDADSTAATPFASVTPGTSNTGSDTFTTSGDYTGGVDKTFTVEVVDDGNGGGGGAINTDALRLKITDSATGVSTLVDVPDSYDSTNGDVVTNSALQGVELNFTNADSFVTGDKFTIDVQGSGHLTLNGIDIALNKGNASTLQDTVNTINQYTHLTGVKASSDVGGTLLQLVSTTSGTGGQFSAQADDLALSKLGLDPAFFTAADTTVTTTNGDDASGQIWDVNTFAWVDMEAHGNELSGAGLTLTLADDPAGNLGESIGQPNGNDLTGTIDVVDNGLVFQIGANAGQTASLRFGDMKANALGKGVTGNTFGSLADINITTASGAQDSIAIVDKAIAQVSGLRGDLGAFQANTLETNANNLRATLENTISAESVIRDTDFAAEIATFTKNQTLLQAGATVLGNANQIPQLIASLLRG